MLSLHESLNIYLYIFQLYLIIEGEEIIHKWIKRLGTRKKHNKLLEKREIIGK